MKFALPIVAAAMLAASPAPTLADIITGSASVIDGDTLNVSGVTVRLKGVDAMERGTPDGDNATTVMRGLVRQGETVTCTVTGEKTQRREVGYCALNGLDLNREIIARGAALACLRYDDRYIEAETKDARRRLQQASYCEDVPSQNIFNDKIESRPPVVRDIFRDRTEARSESRPPEIAPRRGNGGGSRGCGSRGGPGYRLPNGKCASWSD
jgi:Staphylococcal nuclease homologue